MIRGRAGDDVIQGSERADELYGEHGNDVLQGGIDSDRPYGSEGNDIIVGTCDDYLSGEKGMINCLEVMTMTFCTEERVLDMIIDLSPENGHDSVSNCEET
jgi:Ca2+-binding RTX toxin-like protein